MRAALASGQGMINDIYAPRMPGAVDVSLPRTCADPSDAHAANAKPVFGMSLLRWRSFSDWCRMLDARFGVRERIVLDPGFDLASVGLNLTLFQLPAGGLLSSVFQLVVATQPMLAITGCPVGERSFMKCPAAAVIAL